MIDSIRDLERNEIIIREVIMKVTLHAFFSSFCDRVSSLLFTWRVWGFIDIITGKEWVGTSSKAEITIRLFKVLGCQQSVWLSGKQDAWLSNSIIK